MGKVSQVDLRVDCSRKLLCDDASSGKHGEAAVVDFLVLERLQVFFSLDSNISFFYILKGWLQDTFNLHDSCGVNNLHGMPGLLSSFLSVFYCAIASKNSYGDT